MTYLGGRAKIGVSPARRDRAVGVLCGLAIVGLFAGFTLVSRLGLSTALAPADLAALRFGVAGLLLAPVLLRHGLSGLSWRQALSLAFLGGFGFALCAYAGFSLAPATHGAVLLHGTLPLFTVVIMTVITRTLGDRRRAVGVTVIAVGIAAMAWDSVAGARPAQLLGDALLLAASLCWSAYGIAAGRLEVPSVQAAAIVAVLSACGFLPLYALGAGGSLLALEWRDLLVQGLFQGVLIGAVSILVYTRAVAALGAAQTSLFTAAVPCVTALGAIPLLGEWPTPLAWAGVAIATVGMLVGIRGTHRPR